MYTLPSPPENEPTGGYVSNDGAGHVAHHNLTVMTTDDAATMEAFLARPDVRALVWKRLDDTHALVDTEQVSVLVGRLKQLGYSPRFSSTLT